MSLGQILCSIEKSKRSMLLVTKLGIFCIQQELSEGNNISKSVSKRTVQVVSSQLFQEILSPFVYPYQENGMI